MSLSDELLAIPGDFLRLKLCRYGPMLYLSNDLFIGRSLDRYGEFSEGEMELFRQIVERGQVVVDAGANIGTHTVFFAQTMGPGGAVFSFEPQRLIFQVLCANAALNGLSNVFPFHAAAGRERGVACVPALDPAAPQNFGAVSLRGARGGDRVRMMTIDELGLAACHLIKIDVEGMERDVMAGAEQTIARLRPFLYLENEHDEKPGELIGVLFDLGYRLYRHVTPMFRPDNFFGDRENVLGRVSSFNVLGIPQSRPQSVQGLPEITASA